MAVLGGGAFAFQQRATLSAVLTPATVAELLASPARPAAAPAAASQFSCGGRTHFSQMSSCADAQYVLQHCPSTQMDGDHDGVPCEVTLASEALLHCIRAAGISANAPFAMPASHSGVVTSPAPLIHPAKHVGRHD
ncbi:excalibur calcium-binding domain-containing protein [Xanthomonas vasicola]|uniref:excalibur calcium-binding domain-containing protein n=2 Tax=Xanthomonas vasicola TaxID=56459 RepID=UPI0001CBF73A|nr:excalibur calcium-binding domain-containing protein [Xanthomonas vasicola]AZR32854.1 excalibur calcium-binding domain-containing protein [Xanthomonas vasicola pv. musacearum NCPPB 4379]AZR37015.1 excalibur calcium-binding domain-containing protein [Xanthomonas vasicola]MBV6742764.1 excalibur calcium-binding domain-containing protein [Xanthomonas vasicola pv. musacearum NCPPB 2251]MBV7279009.1 excalibur calcium-binding domain-containing protein [Xanthomonas vasicola pv. musacearum]MBV7290342